MKNLEIPKAMGWGVVCGMAVSMLLAAAVAGAIHGGAAPMEWIRYLAWGISAAAGMAAGISASAKLGRARLPAAVGAAGCYVLLTLVLRGVVFGTLGQMPWATAAAVMAGAFAAAIMQSGKKKRRSGRH